MTAAEIGLLVLVVAFATSIGAHYTGACMGMPHALGALNRRQALWLMAPLALLGAAVASHPVEATVGLGLTHNRLTEGDELLVLALAFALTTAYTRARVPTSTIQLLVFSLVGVAVGVGDPVEWGTLGRLVIVWVAAPLGAFLLGLLVTLALARLPAGSLGAPAGNRWRPGLRVGPALIAVGMLASFTMGANDVSNASAALIATGTAGPLVAGVIGGAGLAAGVLVFGGRLLQKVAFDIVKVDAVMAVAAQLVQVAVVLTAAEFGYFTSMNQALVAAMAGASRARGQGRTDRRALQGILKGWAVGPPSGILLGWLAAVLLRHLGLTA